MKRHAIGILLFVGIAVGWGFVFPPNPLASDQQMIDHFRRKREKFEKLVELLRADPELTDLDQTTVSLNGNYLSRNELIADPRHVSWNEYQAIMDDLDVWRISRPTSSSGVIYFSSDSIDVSELDDLEAIVISKKYVYSPWQPSPLADSLDDKNFETSVDCYKRIDGNWYLYFDWGVSKPE